jgi:hypothetical protein
MVNLSTWWKGIEEFICLNLQIFIEWIYNINKRLFFPLWFRFLLGTLKDIKIRKLGDSNSLTKTTKLTPILPMKNYNPHLSSPT